MAERRESTILIVDDDPKAVKLIEGSLADEDYRFISAGSGKSALVLAEKEQPAVILLDIMMPGMDGYEICRRLKEATATRLTPVIMVTALGSREDKIKGVEAGADDFLTKPVDRVELAARVKSLVRLKHLVDRLEEADNVISSLVTALEERDPYRSGHSLRVAELASGMAQQLGVEGEGMYLLQRACLLHDVGKIGMDTIFNKPGPLTREEYVQIKSHPIKSERICTPLAFAAPLLRMIRHHHEWWNGRGYPDGLMFESIPLGARIIAVCDAFDAMTSERPYRAPMPPAKALDRLQDGAGRQWDPELVRVFVLLIASPAQKKRVRRRNRPLW